MAARPPRELVYHIPRGIASNLLSSPLRRPRRDRIFPADQNADRNDDKDTDESRTEDEDASGDEIENGDDIED